MVIRGSYYYKYISIWNRETKFTKQIPIKLAHKDEFKIAEHRKGIVERKALEFKREGKLHLIAEYEFDWETESGVSEWKSPITLQEGIDMYVKKMTTLRRSNTMKMYINSFNHWLKFLKPNKSCEAITTKDLTNFVIKYKAIDPKTDKPIHSDTTINMSLRNLRTLLYFLRDENEIIISTMLKFKNALIECPINDTEIIYITEPEFNMILEGEWCRLTNAKRDWYKKIFQLYWDLGLRLSEGFKGVIKGNYLYISKEDSKNGVARKVRVTPQQQDTIGKLQAKYFEANMSKNHIRGYSKMFKKALRFFDFDESKHFHCLRHSYGIRRRIETNGNIIKIQKEMGHEDIASTQKYLRCDEAELKDDFPTYRKVLDMLENGHLNINSTTIHSTMYDNIPTPNGREIN